MLLLRPSSFGANVVAGLSPAAWFRFGQGVTVTGSGVSQWDDQSGNGRHLLQATDAARPPKQADGSITFNGVAQTLKCTPFTLNQAATVYFLGQMVAFTAAAKIVDGNSSNTMGIQMSGTPPIVQLNAGASAAAVGTLAVGVNGILTAVFNGASSSLQLNASAPATGNAGAGNAGGLTLGSSGGGTQFSNINVKELIVFPAAHDAATISRIVAYLARVGGISI